MRCPFICYPDVSTHLALPPELDQSLDRFITFDSHTLPFCLRGSLEAFDVEVDGGLIPLMSTEIDGSTGMRQRSVEKQDRDRLIGLIKVG